MPMSIASLSLTAFTVLNGARIVAYIPQIMCLCRDRGGAASVSMVTWGMFFSANLATVVYALAVIDDRVVAGVFAANAVACIAIVGLILRKRVIFAWSGQPDNQGSILSLLPPLPRISGLMTRLRDKAEDRIAARHAGGRWSDSTERAIIRDWQDYQCGRWY
jgi:hypothetical protein